MNLLKEKPSKKRTKSNKKIEKRQKKRVMEQANPKAQNSLKYTSQFEEGLMHIVENEYSKMYQLGDLDYEVSTEEEQLGTVMGYAEGLNSLDKKSRYQLLVVNRRVKSTVLEDTLLPYQADEFDNFREEINKIITDKHKQDERNFVIDKYAIFSTESSDLKQANKTIDTISQNFKNRFDSNSVELNMSELDGQERLRVMANLLRPGKIFSATYKDIALSNLSSKAFIVPESFRFPKNKNYFRLGSKLAKVLYIRQYPKYLEDHLIRELCKVGIEMAISVHAKPYDMIEARKTIQTKRTLNNAVIEKQQGENFRRGISEDMISGEAAEISRSTKGLLEEIKENGQKLYSGIFSVYFTADTLEELEENTKLIQDVGHTWQVEFDEVEAYKEEALNSILPIGKPYLDVEMNYMRDMTTSNIATQVPYTNVELQSSDGQFYGQNQLTHNMITINRQKDLIAPNGLIFGSTGAGKGMTVKWEIINAFLRNVKDRIYVVDPESEYIPIGKRFGAEILDISTGTEHHLNILDLANSELLDKEDRTVDLVKEKANLLTNLFESLLKEFSDAEAAIVDRVTRQTYEAFENTEEVPTLVDWYEILKQQGGEIAEEFSQKVEPYTIGSQDIFAHKTNIDLNARFIIFNIKKLDERLKPFAMKVILDQIWKQVVDGQGKVTTRLYFDELQLNFDTEENANWFMALWSRVRKYGSIPTGITQNVSTLLDSPAGRKMISNSEFIILLRQKIGDLHRLTEMIRLTPKLTKYIGDRAPQGTGLISAGGIVVPFENPIPVDTEIYELMNTDA
ncbi:DUF87 domain-containing protein [Enterococcus faecalis]|uniref:VirB4-like conjugal transfer ATPase, CD1110 family n=1 Tax=Enterococcus faecalis TaxID=1351 RepID=UPI000459F0D8|nr:DUF87 domain-containing protein [Enterococcus faecalis]EHV0179363.1 DUF87 domain-containing protein [Enterococcus faecalis]KAJ85617.1 hypothetical protein P791_1216 [Enterococcus faecalis NY9]